MNVLNKSLFFYFLVTGILFSLVGIFGIFSPTLFSIYLIYILAAFFLINVFKNIAKGFQSRHIPEFHWGMFIFLEVLEIIVALSLLTTPFVSQIFMIMYIGVFLILKGIFIIINLLFNKKAFPSLVSYSLSSGIIDLLFGLLLVILPLFSQQFIALCIAWYLLFSGINLIVTAFTLKHSAKK